MDTKQLEAIRIAEWLEGIRGNTWPSYIPQEAAAELRRLQTENEQLRAGYDAARLEIASLKAQHEGGKSEALADLAYAHGMTTGWNLCIADKHDEFARIRSMRSSQAISTIEAPQPAAQPTIVQMKDYCKQASAMMARDLTRFDAACEVMGYLKEMRAPGYYMHRMSIVLHGNVEGTDAARASDKAAQPAAQAQPYDQQAMGLCHICGWKGVIDYPGGPVCVACEHDKPLSPQPTAQALDKDEAKAQRLTEKRWLDVSFISEGDMAAREQEDVGGWRRAGALLYRLTSEHRTTNFDEIRVTMANGSRDIDQTSSRAERLLVMLSAPQPTAQPLHVAATSCPHEIDKDKIVLHFDSKQPGKNALAQLSARLQAAQALDARWVSAKDRLPDPFCEVLVHPRPTDYCCEGSVNTQGEWSYGEYEHHFGHNSIKCNVTHWMPLPTPPVAIATKQGGQ